MSISFLYYLWMLLSLSSGDLAGTHKNPVHHMGAVQIYYFYDSRIPSAIGDAMCGLTKDVLEKNYAKQLAEGDIIFYEIDLASPKGEEIARKCNITITGLVLGRHLRVVNLTQNGYAYAKSDPLAFEQNLAYHINRLLPASKRPE